MLKNIIQTFCLENQDWDEGVLFLIFAAREAMQESVWTLVHGPLKVLKEDWMQENSTIEDLPEYVTHFQTRLSKACELARKNLDPPSTK